MPNCLSQLFADAASADQDLITVSANVTLNGPDLVSISGFDLSHSSGPDYSLSAGPFSGTLGYDKARSVFFGRISGEVLLTWQFRGPGSKCTTLGSPYEIVIAISLSNVAMIVASEGGVFPLPPPPFLAFAPVDIGKAPLPIPPSTGQACLFSSPNGSVVAVDLYNRLSLPG
jgi:hypothetical protein